MKTKTVKNAVLTLGKVFVVNGILLGGMTYGKQWLNNKERELAKEGLEITGQLFREITNERRIRKGRLW